MSNYPLTPINTVQLQQFQAFTDQYGMMQIDGSTSSNGNLFTAHYVYGLISNNIITDTERARINQVYLNNCIQAGLLTRYPGNTDYEAQDDYTGLLAADVMLNPTTRPLANAVYAQGKSGAHGLDPKETSPTIQKENFWAYWLMKIIFWKDIWSWNNVSPGTFSVYTWLGRRLEFIATLQMASKKFVNPFYWVYWFINMWLIYWKADKSNLDSYTLRLHMAIACQGYGPLTNWACSKVHQAIARDFGDFGALLGVYFQNPNHPIVALLKGID